MLEFIIFHILDVFDYVHYDLLLYHFVVPSIDFKQVLVFEQ